MDHVNSVKVKNFIKQYGLNSSIPEGTYSKEGQYEHELINVAVPPPGSDMDDSNLCPDLPDDDVTM